MDLPSLSYPALEAGLSLAGYAVAALAARLAWRYRRLFLAAEEEQRNGRELIDNLSEGIYRSHPNGTQLSANPALVALNGYGSEEEQLRGVKDIAREWYVDPLRRAEFHRLLIEHGRVENFVSEIYRHKTRERIWVSESARLVRHRRTGQPLFYEGSVREVTETIERLAVEERFQMLTRQLSGVLFQMELPREGKARVTYISPGIARITGYDHTEHLAYAGLFNSLIEPADKLRYAQAAAEAAKTLSQWEIEFRIRAKDGTEKWLRMNATPEVSDDALTWHGYVSDISVRKRQEMEIEQLAYFDPLTKLPNRRMFMQGLAKLAGDPGRAGALLFIDLDNFKTLNDTSGHDVGDAYLVQVAERLREAAGEGDVIARLGGDEFVVIAGAGQPDGLHALRYAITLANRIVAALREPFMLGPREHVGSASVGVVGFDGTERRADELLKRADIAMYQAKAAGRNSVALFDPSTMDREASRYRLIQELRAAIAEDQFVLRFQPRYDDERRLKGAEALARWDHPRRGLLCPDEFLPPAEQFGMNVEIGRLVLDKACAALAAFDADPATAGLGLALKMGSKCFTGEQFIPFLRDAALSHGVEVSRLTFELTESIVDRDVGVMVERMQAVKGMGARLLLDGFGQGHSSLHHLRHLPFDEIKIDGRFVAAIEGSEQDRSLVRTILAMARMLHLETVAAEVGNVRQESFLRAFGCQRFQGALYAEAMTADAFRDFAAGHPAGSMSEALEVALKAG